MGHRKTAIPTNCFEALLSKSTVMASCLGDEKVGLFSLRPGNPGVDEVLGCAAQPGLVREPDQLSGPVGISGVVGTSDNLKGWVCVLAAYSIINDSQTEYWIVRSDLKVK